MAQILPLIEWKWRVLTSGTSALLSIFGLPSIRSSEVEERLARDPESPFKDATAPSPEATARAAPRESPEIVENFQKLNIDY